MLAWRGEIDVGVEHWGQKRLEGEGAAREERQGPEPEHQVLGQQPQVGA